MADPCPQWSFCPGALKQAQFALTEPTLAAPGTLRRNPQAFSGKESVTGGPPFLIACLPAPLIIAGTVLKDRAARAARGRGVWRASRMNRLTPRLNPTHERKRGQKTTGWQDLEHVRQVCLRGTCAT